MTSHRSLSNHCSRRSPAWLTLVLLECPILYQYWYRLTTPSAGSLILFDRRWRRRGQEPKSSSSMMVLAIERFQLRGTLRRRVFLLSRRTIKAVQQREIVHSVFVRATSFNGLTLMICFRPTRSHDKWKWQLKRPIKVFYSRVLGLILCIDLTGLGLARRPFGRISILWSGSFASGKITRTWIRRPGSSAVNLLGQQARGMRG